MPPTQSAPHVSAAYPPPEPEPEPVAAAVPSVRSLLESCFCLFVALACRSRSSNRLRRCGEVMTELVRLTSLRRTFVQVPKTETVSRSPFGVSSSSSPALCPLPGRGFPSRCGLILAFDRVRSSESSSCAPGSMERTQTHTHTHTHTRAQLCSCTASKLRLVDLWGLPS
jgi:hypothetical protein